MRLEIGELNPMHYIGIVLALISSVIHFHLGFLIGLTGLGISFLLAGTGFLLGIKLVVLDLGRRFVYLLGIPFVLGQVVYWYTVNQPGLQSFVSGLPLLDVVDKTAQVLLLLVLVYLYRKEFMDT